MTASECWYDAYYDTNWLRPAIEWNGTHLKLQVVSLCEACWNTSHRWWNLFCCCLKLFPGWYCTSNTHILLALMKTRPALGPKGVIVGQVVLCSSVVMSKSEVLCRTVVYVDICHSQTQHIPTAHNSMQSTQYSGHGRCTRLAYSQLGRVRSGSSGLGRLIHLRRSQDEMRWDELRCATVRLGSGWGSRQILLTYDLCIRLPVPAGAFSRGPRGCQAHPNQEVVKYHTLRLPGPNSSVNFSDEPDELGWLIRIWMNSIERLIRKRRSPPNPDEPNRTRP